MKNLHMSVLCFALPFIIGCSTVNATTPAKTWGGSMNTKATQVESFSELDSASQEVRPQWLRATPKAIDGYYFVGMSSKRTEKRDARNESFNDALIGFARFCGLNVQYLAEHRDRSVGGNGGLIDTWTEGNTIAKMQAEMHLGNVTTEDRYTEKYSTFYGGSFMGHTYVDSSLVFVPTEEMELCKEHTTQANTFIKEKASEVNTLTAKNSSLESENKLLKKQNTNLTNVALNQAHNSVEFFKQAGYSNQKQPIKKVVAKKVQSKTITTVATTSKTHDHVKHGCQSGSGVIFEVNDINMSHIINGPYTNTKHPTGNVNITYAVSVNPTKKAKQWRQDGKKGSAMSVVDTGCSKNGCRINQRSSLLVHADENKPAASIHYIGHGNDIGLCWNCLEYDKWSDIVLVKTGTNITVYVNLFQTTAG